MNMAEEIRQIAQVRGTIYTLLSQCFMQPSIELVNSILDGSLDEAFQATLALTEDKKVIEKLAKLKHFGIQCQELSQEQVLQEMKAEYNRLFVGPGHVLAPPYESIYKTRNKDNEKGVVMGDSTVAAKHFYRRAGLGLSNDFTDLPDHISLELHFMGYLCNLEIERTHEESEESKVSEGKQSSVHKMQVDFLETHLGSWISDFSQAVSNVTYFPFYKAVAELAERWIKIDMDELKK